MELMRTLGALIEPPSPAHQRIADLVELGPVPPETAHIDVFLFQLYPYASIYLGAEGRLGGETCDRIAGFWRALGEAPPDEPDHLTVMLALYAEIRERESGQQPPGKEHWRRACRAFLWEHLLSWLPVYLDKLEQLAPSYYCRWSMMLREVLEVEAERLGLQEQISAHFRQVPALADPRSEGVQAFLDALLSPARSGFIVVRDDLVRAGRELGLGVRAGERKFVLKAMLSQQPSETLAWLAREARTCGERHREQTHLLGAAAGYWIHRAESSADLLAALSREAGAHFV